MKRYVFLINSIRNIGGAQLYVANKIEWLEKEGWTTDVYFYNEGVILIDKLKKFWDNRIPQLSLPFVVVSCKDKEKIASRVCEDHKYEQTIFESNETHLCIWGEYFARLTNGMNICYPLSENFPALTTSEKEFFNTKLKNNLLYGITENSIPLMLGSSSLTKNRLLQAVVPMSANVCDNEYNHLDKICEGKTILSIGRLDKPYYGSLVKSLKEFANKHQDVFFNYILLGDAAVPSARESILKELEGLSNVNVLCTGYLNPIPRSLLKRGDVSIGSSGCVLLSSLENILTIAVDAKDFYAMGIYGITTQNIIYRENEPKQEICDLLECVLFKKLFNPKDIKVGWKADYAPHKAIINGYTTSSIPLKLHLNAKQYIMKLLYMLFGYSGLKRVLTLSR